MPNPPHSNSKSATTHPHVKSIITKTKFQHHKHKVKHTYRINNKSTTHHKTQSNKHQKTTIHQNNKTKAIKAQLSKTPSKNQQNNHPTPETAYYTNPSATTAVKVLKTKKPK